MLIAGSPRLVIGSETVWRVPVILTSSEYGVRVEVGTVDVHAVTGELRANQTLKEQILNNVASFLRSTPTPTG